MASPIGNPETGNSQEEIEMLQELKTTIQESEKTGPYNINITASC